MSITVEKTNAILPTNVPDYLILSSDNWTKNKFEYVISIIYNTVDLTAASIYNEIDNVFYISANYTSLTDDYYIGQKVVFGTYCEIIDITSSQIFFKTDYNLRETLGRDTYPTAGQSTWSATSMGLYNVMRTSPDINGLGAFNLNEFYKNLPNFSYNEDLNSTDVRSIYGGLGVISLYEAYLYEFNITGLGTPSSIIYNRFDFAPITEITDSLILGKQMFIEPTEAGGDAFYNGSQKVKVSNLASGYFETDKPQNNGADAINRVGKLTSQEQFYIYDNAILSSYGYGNITNERLINNDYFFNNWQGIPTTNKVNIDDYGYIINTDSISENVTVHYKEVDINGVETTDTHVISSGYVSKIATHPESINSLITDLIDCNTDYYEIYFTHGSFTSKTITYQLNKLPRFRVIFDDEFGNYHGLNFYGKCITRTSSESEYSRRNNDNLYSVSQDIAIDKYTSENKNISTIGVNSYTLNSGYLTKEELDYIALINQAKDCYIYDYNNELRPVTLENFEFKKADINTKLETVILKFKESNVNKTYAHSY